MVTQCYEVRSEFLAMLAGSKRFIASECAILRFPHASDNDVHRHRSHGFDLGVTKN